MKVSKLKFVLLGIVIVGILSLNVINPFSMSNNQFDVKGMADEIPLSTTTSTQAEVVGLPLVAAFAAFVLLHNSARTAAGPKELRSNPSIFDGVIGLRSDDFAISKLD